MICTSCNTENRPNANYCDQCGNQISTPAHPVQAVAQQRGPLEGIKVLDWTMWQFGPVSTMMLGDLGADVIKVERPDGGDSARRLGPFPEDIPHPEKSGLFLYLNTNKKGITLDPSTASGRRLLGRLVADADVLVENNPPARSKELGLEREVRATDQGQRL